MSNFCVFKRSFQTVATARIAPKICQGQPPHIWLTLFQISSKLVHFRRSYCRMREDRFCPVEYVQYMQACRAYNVYRYESYVICN